MERGDAGVDVRPHNDPARSAGWIPGSACRVAWKDRLDAREGCLPWSKWGSVNQAKWMLLSWYIAAMNGRGQHFICLLTPFAALRRCRLPCIDDSMASPFRSPLPSVRTSVKTLVSIRNSLFISFVSPISDSALPGFNGG